MNIQAGWDFTRPDNGKRDRKHVQNKTQLTIGYPPCTPLTVIQNLNWGRSDATDRLLQQRCEEGVGHIQFMIYVYFHQLEHGRYLLHEHLRNATSWKLDCARNLLAISEVIEVCVDQCSYRRS